MNGAWHVIVAFFAIVLGVPAIMGFMWLNAEKNPLYKQADAEHPPGWRMFSWQYRVAGFIGGVGLFAFVALILFGISAIW